MIEINRWFPSSKLCSNCHYQISELSLDVRTWTCPSCGTHHDRDGNAAMNIRAAMFQNAVLLWDGGGAPPMERK
ncbi:zinc ribbon domain-containing protein [Brasilonema bromeliae]|uniref:zinc ribbon domain-containing protein n=1 Tax=Brasilonema bromeliae TaxID=383615 RepID=UPI0030DD77BF